MPAYIVIDSCVVCTACFSICPHDAIRKATVNGYVKNVVIEESLCSCCNECVKVCPVDAIELDCPIDWDDGDDEDDWDDWGNWGEEPGGGSSTHLPIPEIAIPIIAHNKNLKSDALDALAFAISSMLEDCYAVAIYDFVVDNNYMFGSVSIDPSIGGNASTSFGKHSLTFSSIEHIKAETLFHELYHLLQQEYGGATIEDAGMMEYERTLFYDIIYYALYGKDALLMDRMDPWLINGADLKSTTEYLNWLENITEDGIPTHIEATDFFYYANMFKTYSRAYRHLNFPDDYDYRTIEKALSLSKGNC